MGWTQRCVLDSQLLLPSHTLKHHPSNESGVTKDKFERLTVGSRSQSDCVRWCERIAEESSGVDEPTKFGSLSSRSRTASSSSSTSHATSTIRAQSRSLRRRRQ
ncbi:hypothetical protein M422DRAFT_781466, partial [Sphaerobolus stellatus SS14]